MKYYFYLFKVSINSNRSKGQDDSIPNSHELLSLYVLPLTYTCYTARIALMTQQTNSITKNDILSALGPLLCLVFPKGQYVNAR